MNVYSKIVFLIAFFLFAFGCYSQNLRGEARMKTQFIYGFTKYIQWKNQAYFTDFKIGVLGNDSLLIDELESLSKNKTFNKLPFVIQRYETMSDIKNPQILYINNKNDFEINVILKLLKGRDILLISENYPFKSSMINFVYINGVLEFEVNEMQLKDNNFKISEELIKQSVQSADEWQTLYLNTKNQLSKEKKTIENQKEKIEDMARKQEDQKVMIASATKEIDKQRTALVSLVDKNKNQEKILSEKSLILNEKETAISQQDEKIKVQQEEISSQLFVLRNQQEQMALQQRKIDEQKSVLKNQLSKIQQQNLLLVLSVAFLVLLIGFAGVLYRGYQLKRKTNHELEEKNVAISRQNEEIEIQKQLVEMKNQSITSSIFYAKRIQEAIFVSRKMFANLFSEHFIYYQPKDIVSGDFYWAYEMKKQNKLVVAVADCTGHGVPGAFMSMIGNALLNEIIVQNQIEHTDQILEQTRVGIIKALKQTGANDEPRDGMDIALCIIDKVNNTIAFSGAHNSLYLIRDGKVHEYKGDAQHIGFQYGNTKPFTKTMIETKKDDRIYLFTDGFVDQKGGERNKKYLYKPFQDLLLSMSMRPMEEQGETLEREYLSWKGDNEQIDDVCIIGLKLG